MRRTIQTRVQFGPLEETYAILAKFEVSPSEEEQNMLADLEQTWEEFKDMLKEVEQVGLGTLVYDLLGSPLGVCLLPIISFQHQSLR